MARRGPSSARRPKKRISTLVAGVGGEERARAHDAEPVHVGRHEEVRGVDGHAEQHGDDQHARDARVAERRPHAGREAVRRHGVRTHVPAGTSAAMTAESSASTIAVAKYAV
jgi:hypothetical protein